MALTVTIYSFSYKNGIPVSPDGGGYVFDCRGMENPGRYGQFKSLTGNDRPVMEFLESKNEVQPFLAAAWNMVDSHIRNYLSRNFTSLYVCFGCTGGQHRSLYCAEHTALHLKEVFADEIENGRVELKIVHREQGIVKTAEYYR